MDENQQIGLILKPASYKDTSRLSSDTLYTHLSQLFTDNSVDENQQIDLILKPASYKDVSRMSSDTLWTYLSEMFTVIRLETTVSQKDTTVNCV